jgi:hypothetical protein
VSTWLGSGRVRLSAKLRGATIKLSGHRTNRKRTFVPTSNPLGSEQCRETAAVELERRCPCKYHCDRSRLWRCWCWP